MRLSASSSYAGSPFVPILTSIAGGGGGVTIHVRFYPYCEPSSYIPVTPLMVAAFGTIAVELPAYGLSEGYCQGKKGYVFPLPVNKIVFC